jgi:hypothetical protein
MLCFSTFCVGAVGCGPLIKRQAPGSPTGGYRAAVTISRGEFGVPTIEGADEAAALFGLAYAMAEDGFYALEDAYASALGMASSYYGAIEQTSDELRVRLQVVRRAQTEYESLSPAARRPIDAFAEGLNAYVRDHPQIQPRIIARYAPWMVIAMMNDITWVRDVERALGRVPPTHSLILGAGPEATVPRSTLMLVASSARRPYEAEIRVRNETSTVSGSWSAMRAFYEMGAIAPQQGYTNSRAFLELDRDVRAKLSRVGAGEIANSATATDTMRLNTSNGVVIHAVRTAIAGRGVVVWFDADSATVLDTAVVRTGVIDGLRKLTGAFVTADTAGVTAPTGSVTRTFVVAPEREAAANAMMRGKAVWTLQELIRAAFDTRANGAAEEIAALVDEWEQVGARNPDKAMTVDSLIGVIRSWDMTSSIASSAMTLYAFYRAQLRQEHGASFPRFTALESVVRDARRPIQPWGYANALRRGPNSLPVAAAPTYTGTMFTYDATAGYQPFVWAVDIGAHAAGSVFAFGQSQTAGSAHWFDQAPLFAAGSLKEAAVTEAVAASDGKAGRAYHPGESNR